MRFGAAILPPGRRRENLLADIEGMLREAFGERVLPFDIAVAREYADIAAERRVASRSVAPANCQFAAIARSRGMTVATRNGYEFDGIRGDVANPWTVA